MTNKESVLIDFNDNPIYLKSIIKHLIELNKYPDISISYFTNPYIYGIQTKIRAELTLPTGSTITAERIGHSEDLKNEDLKNYLVESLLKEIAYRYIKRAFEKREIGDVKTKASSFGASCISILNENKFEEYQKLKQECVKLNNEIIDMNSIIEDAAINLGNKDFTLYDLPFEIKKLRQECEALKSESFTMDSLISMQEEEIDRYCKALEEIEGLISDDEFEKCPIDGENCNYFTSRKILDIINKAKGAEDER